MVTCGKCFQRMVRQAIFYLLNSWMRMTTRGDVEMTPLVPKSRASNWWVVAQIFQTFPSGRWVWSPSRGPPSWVPLALEIAKATSSWEDFCGQNLTEIMELLDIWRSALQFSWETSSVIPPVPIQSRDRIRRLQPPFVEHRGGSTMQHVAIWWCIYGPDHHVLFICNQQLASKTISDKIQDPPVDKQ